MKKKITIFIVIILLTGLLSVMFISCPNPTQPDVGGGGGGAPLPLEAVPQRPV